MEEFARIITRDHHLIRFRKIRPDDSTRLSDFFYALSPRSRSLRFASDYGNMPEEKVMKLTAGLSDVDHINHIALVGVIGEEDQEAIIGVARAIRRNAHPMMAEISLVIRDDMHNYGLGTKLLGYLVLHARKVGIRHFIGLTSGENRAIMRVFDKLKLKLKDLKVSQGQQEFRLDLDEFVPGPEYVDIGS